MADDLPPAYSPQAITDILPIYRPSDSDSRMLTYTLRQKSPNVQTLTLKSNTTTAASTPTKHYNIKTYTTGGFMNRKPHIIISGTDTGRRTAEARFDVMGTGTTINYFEPSPTVQHLELKDSRLQLLSTQINGMRHWWEPNPGNKAVLELTNEAEEIVARFTQTIPVFPVTGTKSKKGLEVEVEIGELQVVEELTGGELGREEVLCSAITVIERAKRRAVNIRSQTSTHALSGNLSSGATMLS